MAARPTGLSVSAQWREKGNAFYKEAQRDGVAPVLKAGKLQQAINHYDRALSTAADDSERSSASKNAAMANWRMAKAEMAMSAAKAKVKFYLQAALKNFQEAKKTGRNRTVEWNDHLEIQSEMCWWDIHEWVDGWEIDERVRELEQLVPLALDGPSKAQEFYNIAEIYFHQSLIFLGEWAYKDCLRLLAECYFPLNEARRVGHTDSAFLRECDFMDEDITVQRCVAESIQARIEGEELLKQVIRDEEILNIDMIWEVVDMFCHAAMLTRERNLELEAMALSNLGKIYDQILKLKDRAKKCLMKALELANTMVPRTFVGDEWYEFARSTVERYQQEKVAKEEEAKQKEREGIMKLIKEELDVLTSNFDKMGKLEFLKFVYTTHPPKNSAHKLGEVSSQPEPTELKKLYQKAVIHYHPDKVNVEEHGAKWKVLTEEITKLLTRQYEDYKRDPMSQKDD